MSTTQTVLGINKVVGPLGYDLFALRFDVLIDGTYNTGARPNFDVLAAIQSHMHQGASAVAVKAVTLLQDGDDTGVVSSPIGRITAPNADISLSSTGNKVVTMKLFKGTGATNGDEGSGAELSTDAVHHVLSFLVVLTITGSQS